MRIAITGEGTLAAATRAGCASCFTVVTHGPIDLLWICEDMPLNSTAAEWFFERIDHYLVREPFKTPVLISSQIPLGTIVQLEREHPERSFAYSPENLRVATATEDFAHQARIVIGRRNTFHDSLWHTLVAPFTSRLILTDPETAELIKHTLNAFLGLQIAFINEIGRIAVKAGGDMTTVAEALRTEDRISPRAPLMAGAPFGKGHLARDIVGLTQTARNQQLYTPILSAILSSNNA